MIDLRHLRTFIAVAELLHFTQAARQLNVAQAALSQTIRQLETEIGVVLIERTSRRVELTHAGKVFYGVATETVRTLERGIISTVNAGSGAGLMVRLGITSSGLYGCLPEMIRRYRESFRDVTLYLEEYSPDKLLIALDKGEVDAAIARGNRADTPFCSAPIGHDLWILAIPATHRLAKARKNIPLKQLENETLLTIPRAKFPEFYDSFDKACKCHNMSPQLKPASSTLHALIGLAEASEGIAIIPLALATRRTNVVYRHILNDPVSTPFSIYWFKQCSQVALDFVRAIVDSAGTSGPK